MFVIKTFADDEQIREIWVRDTTERTVIGDYVYVIEKPKYPDSIRKVIFDRNEGDLELAIKALRLVQRNTRRFPPEEE